jgi:lipoate-protein ligase A
MNNSTIWRLIQDHPAPGAWNMAMDEAVLQAVGSNESPATLRLYAWSPACLSLGYSQGIEEIDIGRIQSLGWELVRRPTGGQAILHVDELTYAVIGPVTEPRLAGDVLESYQRLSAALLAALEILGIPAQALPKPDMVSKGASKDPICFEVPSNYEISVSGKKLIGSAQARKHGGVLQHGTLPLCGSLSRITQALYFPNEAQRELTAQRMLGRATTVEQVLGKKVAWDEAAQAFIEAFQKSLNIQLIPAELSAVERECAQGLVKEKYGNLDWTITRGVK